MKKTVIVFNLNSLDGYKNMQEQIVNVRIDKDSNSIKIECEGFQGDSCDIIKKVEEYLGTTTSYKETSEKYTYIQPDLIPNQIQD